MDGCGREPVSELALGVRLTGASGLVDRRARVSGTEESFDGSTPGGGFPLDFGESLSGSLGEVAFASLGLDVELDCAECGVVEVQAVKLGDECELRMQSGGQFDAQGLDTIPGVVGIAHCVCTSFLGVV